MTGVNIKAIGDADIATALTLLAQTAALVEAA